MTVLLTGFEGYGGRSANPSEEIVRGLDGAVIAGETVQGRCLAVELRSVGPAIRAAMAECAPTLVVCLGLWPGESMLRLERVAINQADFDIPDNAGLTAREPLDPAGPAAWAATLPLHAIRDRLLAAGIPCHLSGTAGQFLCNAVLYHALAACAARASAPPCGFIHLPYLPQQVADLAAAARDGLGLAVEQRADLASMNLELMAQGVRLAIETSLAMRRDEP
jgi:pyroglutamyl-peptidase